MEPYSSSPALPCKCAGEGLAGEDVSYNNEDIESENVSHQAKGDELTAIACSLTTSWGGESAGVTVIKGTTLGLQ